ncbi:RagB/SusD family nutrient uptake outer membrane protein [Sphingobacterium psychroaquaticum]|nr:RagB/SusD family nutrient uptake outer membrane protein [Sphingobacterium psychroaquaticum]QBQ40536.1 RagB/SusD family nutrient uptake outer membrane protein [Sphingobacterium psychroaquaticum]
MKTKFKTCIIGLGLIFGLSTSCNKFLDVVPDNAPVLDQAFSMRTMAERYLVTCYSSLPESFSVQGNAGLLSGDEFWLSSEATYSGYHSWRIALGSQNGDNPLLNAWDGNNGAKGYWIGITNCNIFLENIMRVPDMTEDEKLMWTSEVKFLKAYYHFLLLRQYGPIPIRDNNIPIYDAPGSSQLARNTVEECFNYIVGQIDDAMENLMDDVTAVNSETGRITKIVAKAMKAEILIHAASPLYNGNTGVEASITNVDGTKLFNQTYLSDKWQKAAEACKVAIDFAHQNGKALHTWTPTGGFIPQASTQYQMNIREAYNENTGNAEILWLDTKSTASGTIQGYFMLPRYTPNATTGTLLGFMSATLNIVEKFYSKNGVPIEEDITYPYTSRFDLITVPSTDGYKYDLVAGKETARMNLDRENRFYGTLMFDAGRVFMLQATSDANAYNIDLKYSGTSGKVDPNQYNWTGYASKKHYNYRGTVGASNAYTARVFGHPVMRLANLYLYYAEALNELNGPSAEAYAYIDVVRKRSGLPGVVEAWQKYSSNPTKPSTKEGLRQIIKSERTSEFALEGIRFWDLRRWRDAVKEYNSPILGWDINQSAAGSYYRTKLLYTRSFMERDYFWPLSLNERRRNPNLVQAAGW